MKVKSTKIFCAVGLFFALPPLAEATIYDLAADAEIIQIVNSGSTIADMDKSGVVSVDDFYIITNGGTGECIGKPILFQAQNMSNASQYRAFMLALEAFTHGLRIHVYSNIGASASCRQANFIELKK